MLFDATARTLTLEPKDCTTCTHGDGEQGQYTRTIACQVCAGTGKGKRGGVRGCKACYGSGKGYDWGNPIVCPTCEGNYQGFTTETFCDDAPDEAVQAMPVVMVSLDRANTFNENFLGMGTLFSVTDYGTMWERSEDERRAHAVAMIARERVQATKIVRSYETRTDNVATLHDALMVSVTRTGWAVRGMSDLPAEVMSSI